jgi:hypothetical protein
MKWLEEQRGDPTAWLLESDNPAIRYRTLRELLDRPADDPEVLAAQGAIPTHPPVADLLEAQKGEGHWVKRDYYLPKHSGTFWVLTVLADLGLGAEDEHVRRGCEFMFGFQRDNGAFCRRRRISGRGVVWDDQPGPCTHARIVRFLIQFGYADDSRTRAGVEWLLRNQRDDGMWHCNPAGRYGCLRATLDVLRVASLEVTLSSHPAIQRGAAAVCDLLMRPSLSRYHVGDRWTVLAYPYFGISLTSALEALAHLGHAAGHPKISPALEYLLSRQSPDGTWPLDGGPYRPPLDFGRPGQPNYWLTLDAMRVVKLLCGRD